MKIELFSSPGCPHCAANQAKPRAAAEAAVSDLEWREVNPVEEIDHAVALGVLTLPSIAIDGELVFTSLPTEQQLRDALLKRAGRT
jgi:hypothetical protein